MLALSDVSIVNRIIKNLGECRRSSGAQTGWVFVVVYPFDRLYAQTLTLVSPVYNNQVVSQISHCAPSEGIRMQHGTPIRVLSQGRLRATLRAASIASQFRQFGLIGSFILIPSRGRPEPSVGSVSDSEVIHRRGPWRSFEAVGSRRWNGSTGSTMTRQDAADRSRGTLLRHARRPSHGA